MDFLSNLFGTAGNVAQGYFGAKAAEKNESAAKKAAAAQNNYTETIKKYAPIGLLIGGGLLVFALSRRGK